jgi:hypothetical protein
MESRRAALVKFGRYAALAPSTMILLEPREGDAAQRNRRPRRRPRRQDDYFDD